MPRGAGRCAGRRRSVPGRAAGRAGARRADRWRSSGAAPSDRTRRRGTRPPGGPRPGRLRRRANAPNSRHRARAPQPDRCSGRTTPRSPRRARRRRSARGSARSTPKPEPGLVDQQVEIPAARVSRRQRCRRRRLPRSEGEDACQSRHVYQTRCVSQNVLNCSLKIPGGPITSLSYPGFDSWQQRSTYGHTQGGLLFCRLTFPRDPVVDCRRMEPSATRSSQHPSSPNLGRASAGRFE